MERPPITTDEAAISTVAVQLKTVIIGKKQMTLSVFRQIKYEQILTDEGVLKGHLWGHVNYWKDRNYDREWLHVLWQKGNELRRSITYYHFDQNQYSTAAFSHEKINNLKIAREIFENCEQLFIAV
jgi:hypothetical protein